MKNKWLYKVALGAVPSAMIAPMIVSCSVEKPKAETQEEKAKRLEHQRSMEIAPNLTKFLDDYYDEEKYYREGRDTSEMKEIRSIKQFKELTSNINHLNDFEKSYLGLYEDIQNFFNNSIHRYTKDNVVFDYWYRPNDDRENESFFTHIKLDKNSLKTEQMFYHQIYQIIREYASVGLEGTTNKYIEGKEVLITEVLDKELTPIINEKIAEFSKKYKDFQFKNPKLTFREVKGDIVIEVALEVEYQNQKLPEQIVFPLSFNLNKINTYLILRTDKEIKELFLENKKISRETEDEGMQRKDVKTLDELKQLFATKPNEWNNEKIKDVEKDYNKLINQMNEKDKEPDR